MDWQIDLNDLNGSQWNKTGKYIEFFITITLYLIELIWMDRSQWSQWIGGSISMISMDRRIDLNDLNGSQWNKTGKHWIFHNYNMNKIKHKNIGWSRNFHIGSEFRFSKTVGEGFIANVSWSQISESSTLFTSRVSGRGNRIGPVFPSFRLSVCQFVSALMAEPFGVPTQRLVWGLTLMKSRPSLIVNVIGQRSRSQG